MKLNLLAAQAYSEDYENPTQKKEENASYSIPVVFSKSYMGRLRRENQNKLGSQKEDELARKQNSHFYDID